MRDEKRRSNGSNNRIPGPRWARSFPDACSFYYPIASFVLVVLPSGIDGFAWMSVFLTVRPYLNIFLEQRTSRRRYNEDNGEPRVSTCSAKMMAGNNRENRDDLALARASRQGWKNQNDDTNASIVTGESSSRYETAESTRENVPLCTFRHYILQHRCEGLPRLHNGLYWKLR